MQFLILSTIFRAQRMKRMLLDRISAELALFTDLPHWDSPWAGQHTKQQLVDALKRASSPSPAGGGSLGTSSHIDESVASSAYTPARFSRPLNMTDGTPAFVVHSSTSPRARLPTGDPTMSPSETRRSSYSSSPKTPSMLSPSSSPIRQHQKSSSSRQRQTHQYNPGVILTAALRAFAEVSKWANEATPRPPSDR